MPAKELADFLDCISELQESAANLIRSYECLPVVPDEDDVVWQPGSLNKIAKFNEEQSLVFGWASIAANPDGDLVVDHHADTIEPVELEKAAYEYVLKFGDAGEMHRGESVGKLVESLVMTPDKASAMGIPAGVVPTGWWIGMKIADPEVFAKVKTGEYPMFSIQGTGERDE